MVKKIVFVAGSGGKDLWVGKISQELSKREKIIPHFIATSKKNTDVIHNMGYKLNDIAEIIPFEGWVTPNLPYLSECEKKYSLNIWDLWYVSSVRSKKRQKMSQKKVLGYFQYVFEKTERILKEFSPDYYLCYGAAAFHAIIFREVFRQNNVKVIDLRPSIIPNHFTIFKDLSNIDPGLTRAYLNIKGREISKKERKEAEQFIIKFRNKPLQQDCARKFKRPLSKKLMKYWSYALELIKYRKLPPNLRYFFWPIIQKIYDSIGIFEKPKLNERYILYPLHFQPESTTLIHGKWYVDQASLIENISKSTPITHKIYVKEHPNGYGNRSLQFYKRIKRLQNVRLISPHENTFNLIRGCSLVATITGTTGWEALLFQKPVITFGNRFYNIFDGVKKIEKIEELPQIIQERLDQKNDYEDLLKVVTALFRSSYRGLARYPGSCEDLSLKDENIKLLTEGIIGYFNTLDVHPL